MTLDWSSGALADGLACYGRAEFFEAHEHWESAWLQSAEPEKSFLQALIQVTAAFHHLQTGNFLGTVTLLQRALKRLDLCPASFGGIAVAPLRDEIAEWLRSLENGTPSLNAARPQICPTPPN